ncbi:Ig-like domain-containing protein [candidate division TA06 bacterium]|uniref:Intimin n=1 Tax=candidate division TA06 bacterium TaxID=2250710 RepID=A0A933IC52_UNCT6|nr:Ig-like domain-containing protein [candidate division TA06 bacterium]
MFSKKILAIAMLLVLSAALPFTWLACSKSSPTAPGDDTTPPPTTTTIDSVILAPTSYALVVGNTVQFTATAYDSGVAVSSTYTWSSSNATIASVSTTGMVTGVTAGGPVTITATVTGTTMKGTASVTVVSASAAGAIYVTSTPSGASIYLDGISASVGTTPDTISLVAAGSHDVDVILAGYPTQTRTINVLASQVTPVNFVMTAAASIIISANPTSIAADGNSNSKITAYLKDSQNHPIPDGSLVIFRIVGVGGINPGMITANDTTNAGKVEANITSSTVVGSVRAYAIAGPESSSVTINYTPGDAAAIGLGASPTTLIPDGISSSTITATVTDAYGNPVRAGTSVAFTTTLGTITSSATTNTAGVATAKLTSATKTGTANITATCGQATAQTSVVFSEGGATLALGSSPASILANGVSASTITATLTDGVNPISGQTILFATNSGTITASAVTNAAGIATATLVSTASAANIIATVTAQAFVVKGKDFSASKLPQTTTVTFEGVTFTLGANPASITANGSSTSAITATLTKTVSGAPIAGAAVNFSTVLGTITASAITNASGVAGVTLKSGSSTGTNTVTATYGATLTRTQTVEFTAVVISTVAVSASSSSIVANGTSSTTITALVKDNAGYPVPDGTPVTFNSSAGSITPSSATKDGSATATLTSSSTPASASVTATAGSITSASITVNFIAGEAATITITATRDSLVAGSAQIDTIRATVRDGSGNLVPDGVVVNFATTLGSITNSTTTVSGVATAYLTPGTVAGNAVITATSGTASANYNVVITPGGVNSIEIQTSSNTIQVSGTGGIETCVLTATVYDQNGNKLSDGTSVSFTILRGPGAGENLNKAGYGPVVIPTAGGVAKVSLNSGTKSGTVDIRITSGSVTSGAPQVTITAGPPFSLSLSTEIYSNVAKPSPGTYSAGFSALVQDKYSNPVADGRAVYFTLFTDSTFTTQFDSASIEGSGVTGATVPGSGIATVKMFWDSKPTFHNLVVRAETSGDSVWNQLAISIPIVDPALEVVLPAYFDSTKAVADTVSLSARLTDAYNVGIDSGAVYFSASGGKILVPMDVTDINGWAYSQLVIPAKRQKDIEVTFQSCGVEVKKTITASGGKKK